MGKIKFFVIIVMVFVSQIIGHYAKASDNKDGENYSWKNKTIVVSKVAKHQNLPEILDEYAEKGYCIIGPLQVTNISSKYIYLYRRGRVDKDNVKILNENDKKGVQLYNGDWVYLLRKGERVILIKTRKKESKNE